MNCSFFSGIKVLFSYRIVVQMPIFNGDELWWEKKLCKTICKWVKHLKLQTLFSLPSSGAVSIGWWVVIVTSCHCIPISFKYIPGQFFVEYGRFETIFFPVLCLFLISIIFHFMHSWMNLKCFAANVQQNNYCWFEFVPWFAFDMHLIVIRSSVQQLNRVRSAY